ncbi:MAG: YdaU family protein [Solirubrobacterales bacterium]|jgi:uncharacterized protein YdaU (DUF1376 family)
MASFPYMPFYWGDYFRDTHQMTTLEHGAYLLLIGSYWSLGGPLPDNDKKLAKLVKLSPPEWLEMREELQSFFEVKDGLWRHPRIDRELEKAAERFKQSREAARRSAEVRAARKEQGAGAQAGVKPTISISRTKEGSDANASGGEPPDLGLNGGSSGLPDPTDFENKVDWFFHPAVVTFMCSGGANEKSARAFIGKCRATLGEQLALKRIIEAFDEKVSDPVGWLTSRFPKARNNTGVNRRTFDDVDYGPSGKL